MIALSMAVLTAPYPVLPPGSNPNRCLWPLTVRWFGVLYLAQCPTCSRVFTFQTHHVEGAADRVDVVCDFCNKDLGRVREDLGGDYRLGEGEQCQLPLQTEST